MVSRDYQALAARRAARARILAERYPASREALLFFSSVADLQGRLTGTHVDVDRILAGRDALIRLTVAEGSDLLAAQAAAVDDAACRESIRAYLSHEDTTSPASFFARVLLQPVVFQNPEATPALCEAFDIPDFPRRQHVASCPSCGHDPQVACLRAQGDGSALSLTCSLCLYEWPYTRLRCPSCGESGHDKISFYSSPEFAHLELQACETCKVYLHSVNLSKDIEAVPEADELAALLLDVWALERGYRKIHPNLVGI